MKRIKSVTFEAKGTETNILCLAVFSALNHVRSCLTVQITGMAHIAIALHGVDLRRFLLFSGQMIVIIEFVEHSKFESKTNSLSRTKHLLIADLIVLSCLFSSSDLPFCTKVKLTMPLVTVLSCTKGPGGTTIVTTPIILYLEGSFSSQSDADGVIWGYFRGWQYLLKRTKMNS